MKTDIKVSTLPVMSVNRMVELLSDSYVTLFNAGKRPADFPSVMLWGAPGVGKSQGVRQIAKRIEDTTGKQVTVTDVRLLLFNPIDLRGIPTANEDKTLAIWLKPQIFNMDESDDVINILFLDEISAAPQSVQAAAYQITLDRVIGEHRIPDNCIVIAAGNRVTDKSVAYKMPKALANRLMHIEIENSFNSWKEWALKEGINSQVIAYLSYCNGKLLDDNSGADDLAYATPRTWEMVSDILNNVSNDLDYVFPLIQGLVGVGTATEFIHWSKVHGVLPNIEDIFDGKNPSLPKSIDALHVLVSSMTSYARSHKDDLKRITNSVIYATNMPADFSVVLIKNYMSIDEDYRQKLMTIPEFARWVSKNGKLLNGI